MRFLRAGVTLAVAILGTLYHRVFPHAPVRRVERVALPGLRDAAEVRWDRWGVPHVYAKSQADAFLLQGYLHAEDRLWQMELHRRIGSGRLSEIFGERTLEADRFLRRVGLHRVAVAEVAGLSPEAGAMLEAYCRGVNGWLKDRRRLPLEFALLGFTPQPWCPADCLLWGKLMGWGLALNWDVELFRAGLADRVGQETAASIEWSYPGGHPLTASPGTESSPPSDPGPAAARALSAILGGGSNAWVVSGERSATGKPLLANDPHLVPQLPSVWYEIHLDCPEFQVSGASLPGAPGIMIGHNERIAWGITASMVDTQDVYLEEMGENGCRFRDQTEPVQVVREEIRVRGRTSIVDEEVVVTRHGPVLFPMGYALRSSLLDPGTVAEAALQLLKAGTWDRFRAALALWDAPSLNFLYADVDGNIGYQLAGRTPRRPEGTGLAPLPGWTGEHEWDGYLSPEELPHALNPAEGYLVNANNKPTADGGPYLAGEWVDGYRAMRIIDQITASLKLDLIDLARMQKDVLSLPALEFKPFLRGSPLLREWDARMTADSAAACVYSVFRVRLFYGLLRKRLGEKADVYFGIPVHPLATTSSYQFRGTSGALAMLKEDGAAVVDQALGEAMRELERLLGPNPKGWKWGKLHRAGFEHPLGAVRVLGWLLNRGPYPVGGDGDTVLQSSYSFRTPYAASRWLPSLRFIADTSNWDRCLSVHVPGQSGRPGARHYDDQIAIWLRGEHHPMPFTRPAVEAATESLQYFVPVSRE